MHSGAQPDPPTALLDQWMPAFDAAARYEITVGAGRPVTWQALFATDFGGHPLVRGLMALRALPALISAPGATWRRLRRPRTDAPLSLRTVLSGDFALLAEQPPVEVVMGITGRFWTASGALVPTDPATFRHPPPPGMAQAAWNFRLAEITPATTLLRTETRVHCADAATRRAFLRYWRVVQPGSGLIRRIILRQVRHAAEAAQATAE